MRQQYLKYYIFSLAILGAFFIATGLMAAKAWIPCDDSYWEEVDHTENGNSNTCYLNGGLDHVQISVYHKIYIHRWVSITGRVPNCNYYYGSYSPNGDASSCQIYWNFLATITENVYVDITPIYTKSLAPATQDIQLKVHYEVHAGTDHKSMDYWHVWDLTAAGFVEETDWYNS